MSLARHRLISLVGVVAALVLLVVLALLARLDIKPAPTASVGVSAPLAIGTELQEPRPVPSVPLINAQGQRTSLAGWRGKWVILAPSMTLCHEVCPLTTGALTVLVNDVRLAGLAAASAGYGRQVAFLGADTSDSTPDARSFLAQHPVSYPSYPVASTDLSSLAVLGGFPTTIFINPAGKVVFVHTGQYQSEAALDNDIQHYALGVRQRQLPVPRRPSGISYASCC